MTNNFKETDIELVNNSLKVKATEGLSAREHTIGVAVRVADLKNGGTPELYAKRHGMLYDSKNGFKPDIAGAHSIAKEDFLIEEFYSLLPEARKRLAELQANFNKNDNSEDVEKLMIRIKNQSEYIDELQLKVDQFTNKAESEENSLIKQLQETIKAQNAAIEKLKQSSAVEKIKHYMHEKILKLINLGMNVYLYGPAGTGKSQLAEDIAESAGLKFYPASTLTQEFKLTGFIDGNGKFHDTNFYKAVKEGGLFFLDEMDSCVSEVLVAINGCLANKYFDFPEETVKAHKNFRMIAAGNTIGRGADNGYVARQPLDLSTLDRFLAVPIEYDENIDIAVAKNDMDLVKFAHAIRQAADTSGIAIIMSYRAISNIAKLLNEFDLEEILQWSIMKGMPSDDMKMLARNMNIDSTNKYYKAFKKAA